MSLDINIATLLPIAFAAGYWALGYVESVLAKTGEPLDVPRTIRTLACGFAVGILQGLAGITIDPATVTTWAGFDALLVVALNKGLNVYSAAPALTAPPSTAAAAAGTAATIPTGGSPPQPAGKVQILGIYGHSALGGVPAKVFSCDVNQVPEIFFDTVTLVTGKVILGVQVDGWPLKELEMQGYSLTRIGEQLPHGIWIPQKYRVPGEHTVQILTGYLTALGVTWDGAASFTLTFTGTKASE